MQEDIEQRTMSVTVQAAKLSGRVLKACLLYTSESQERGEVKLKNHAKVSGGHLHYDRMDRAL